MWTQWYVSAVRQPAHDGEVLPDPNAGVVLRLRDEKGKTGRRDAWGICVTPGKT